MATFSFDRQLDGVIVRGASVSSMAGYHRSHGRLLACLKVACITSNTLIFLFGCVAVAVGAWGLFWRAYSWALWDSLLLKGGAWVVTIGGACLLFLALIGWGAWAFQSKRLVFVHCGFLLVIVIALMTGGIMAVGSRQQSGLGLKKYLQMTLEKYYGVELDHWFYREVTYAWDITQNTFSCCAVNDNGWKAYRTSAWYHQQPVTTVSRQPLVPATCCTKGHDGEYNDLQKCQKWREGPPGSLVPNNNTNHALHYKGCYSSAQRVMLDYSSLVGGMGIGFGLIMILGLISSVALYRYLTSD